MEACTKCVNKLPFSQTECTMPVYSIKVKHPIPTAQEGVRAVRWLMWIAMGIFIIGMFFNLLVALMMFVSFCMGYAAHYLYTAARRVS